MKFRVISGGQTGADRGGIEAALHYGVETGGYAPRYYFTDTGSDYKLKDFGLVECNIQGYTNRTRFNVLDSHGTAIFGEKTGGTLMTIKFCEEHNKPYILNPDPGRLVAFVEQWQIRVLNVAGNRESKKPGIQKEVYDIISKFLELYEAYL